MFQDRMEALICHGLHLSQARSNVTSAKNDACLACRVHDMLSSICFEPQSCFMLRVAAHPKAPDKCAMVPYQRWLDHRQGSIWFEAQSC